MHESSTGGIISGYFGAEVICLEFLKGEVGEIVNAEDCGAIDGALLGIENIQSLQGLFECFKLRPFFSWRRVLSGCKTCRAGVRHEGYKSVVTSFEHIAQGINLLPYAGSH